MNKCNNLHRTKNKNNNISKEKKKDIEIKKNKQAKLKSFNMNKREKNQNQKKFMFFGDTLLSRFISPTESVRKKCDVITKKVKKTPQLNNKINKMTREEVMQYEMTTKKLQNNAYVNFEESISNCKTYFSPCTDKRCEPNQTNFNHNINHHKDNSHFPLKTTYDLIKPVMFIDDFHINNNKYSEKIEINRMSNVNTQIISKLTFESHRYDKHEIIKPKALYHKTPQNRFITSLSKVNYHMSSNNCKLKKPRSNRHSSNNTKSIELIAENTTISKSKEIFYSTILSKNYHNSYYRKYNCIEKMPNKNMPCINITSSSISKIDFGRISIRKDECISENKNNSKREIRNRKLKKNAYSPEELITVLHHSKVYIENIEENLHKAINYSILNTPTNFQSLEEQGSIIEPVNVCQTLLGSEDIFASEIVDNSHLSIFHNIISKDDNANISHYFTNLNEFIKSRDVNKIKNTTIRNNTIDLNIGNVDQITDRVEDNLDKSQLADKDCHKIVDITTDFRYFNLKNRLRFVPKGNMNYLDNI